MCVMPSYDYYLDKQNTELCDLSSIYLSSRANQAYEWINLLYYVTLGFCICSVARCIVYYCLARRSAGLYYGAEVANNNVVLSDADAIILV